MSIKATRKSPKRLGSLEKKRFKISQADVPFYPIDEALRIADTIAAQYAYKPTSALKVAKALGMSPNGTQFRMLCGSSIAYGITKGGAFAPEISIEPLGMRIVRPTLDGDDQAAKKESFLKPKIVGDFLSKYDKAALPRIDIAQNVLMEMGVPSDRTERVLNLILEGATVLGFIQEIRGKKYVDLDSLSISDELISSGNGFDNPGNAKMESDNGNSEKQKELGAQNQLSGQKSGTKANRRVFITHGKNTAFLEPIKKLLSFGELEPVISIEKQTVAQPVPDKVMNDMRTCGAAIIHVEDEIALMDTAAQEHKILNSNVLIEIGAAMALYGRRFILLVKEGINLPSNLQGLYEVRYNGDSLDGKVTIKLLEAIRDIKNHPLPEVRES